MIQKQILEGYDIVGALSALSLIGLKTPINCGFPIGSENFFVRVSTMPKKSSSKPTTPKPKDPVVVEERKISSTTKKPSNEIDEIFARKKRKKLEREKVEKRKENEDAKPDKLKEKKKKKKKVNKDSEESVFVDPPLQPRKRTNDGLTVYTEEELGIANTDAGASLPGIRETVILLWMNSFEVGALRGIPSISFLVRKVRM
ncbi:unnamed protein product [Camellia sinensis]